MEQPENSKFGKSLRAGLMIALYMGMFVLITFTSLFDNLFVKYPQFRIGMGAIFLIYGLFRAYRLWKTL